MKKDERLARAIGDIDSRYIAEAEARMIAAQAEADANKIVDLLLNNPDLLIKVLKSALFANNS